MLGTVGVFEFVNGLNEPVRIGNSFYKSAYRPGTTPKIGDFGARPLVADPTAPFAACSTNVFLMWAPTNGGAYRAVMYCPLEYSDHEAPFAQSQPFAIGR